MHSSEIVVTLSARSRAAVSLSTTASGSVCVCALDDADDPAASHLSIGDVVLSINGEPCSGSSASINLLERPSDALELRISRAVETDPGSALSCPENCVASSFGCYGLEPGQFSMPANVLSLPDGDVVVADGGGCRLQIMSSDGLLRRTLGMRGGEFGQLNYPAGLCMSADGKALFVADRGNSRIQLLRLSDGSPLASTRLDDTQLLAHHGQLRHPWGVALHGSRLYTCDASGSLAVFEAQSLCHLGSYASGDADDDRLISPHGMAMETDRLFVADYDQHKIAVLDMPGPSDSQSLGGRLQIAEWIGQEGSSPGEFRHPVGVALHGFLLYVSEFTGRRVQVLSIGGEPLQVLVPPSRTRLLGLCVGEQRIHVGDFDGDQVHWWSQPLSSGIHEDSYAFTLV